VCGGGGGMLGRGKAVCAGKELPVRGTCAGIGGVELLATGGRNGGCASPAALTVADMGMVLAGGAQVSL
jgi:hypothetical protein